MLMARFSSKNFCFRLVPDAGNVSIENNLEFKMLRTQTLSRRHKIFMRIDFFVPSFQPFETGCRNEFNRIAEYLICRLKIDAFASKWNDGALLSSKSPIDRLEFHFAHEQFVAFEFNDRAALICCLKCISNLSLRMYANFIAYLAYLTTLLNCCTLLQLLQLSISFVMGK